MELSVLLEFEFLFVDMLHWRCYWRVPVFSLPVKNGSESRILLHIGPATLGFLAGAMLEGQLPRFTHSTRIHRHLLVLVLVVEMYNGQLPAAHRLVCQQT